MRTRVEGGATDDAEKELEEMKARMKAIEEEAAKIEAMQSQIEESLKPQTGGGSEADARSIFLGNVDYSTTPEDLEEYFQSCGAINRITIPTDKFTGMSKGFAYIEFKDAEAVNNALLLNGVDFKGRPLKIVGKRTNVPGLRGRVRFPPRPPRLSFCEPRRAPLRRSGSREAGRAGSRPGPDDEAPSSWLLRPVPATIPSLPRLRWGILLSSECATLCGRGKCACVRCPASPLSAVLVWQRFVASWRDGERQRPIGSKRRNFVQRNRCG
jgi:polyadenylate-binding protein 2